MILEINETVLMYEVHATFAMVATILALTLYMTLCVSRTVVIEHTNA